MIETLELDYYTNKFLFGKLDNQTKYKYIYLMEIIGWIIAFIIAIIIHEASHAWAADRLGDPTARLNGRLSLNPIVHYDPVGTSLLVVLIIMRALGASVIPFGWAKPVPLDPYNLKNPKKDSALISFAGPGSNLILAFLLSLTLRIGSLFFPFSYTIYSIAIPIIILNISLAIFNLLPIHPLDGGKILVGILPSNQADEADLFLNRYGTFILILLIFPSIGGISPISALINPVIGLFMKILIPSF